MLQAILGILRELHQRPVALENGSTVAAYQMFLCAFPELRKDSPDKDVLWSQLVQHKFVDAVQQGQQSEADRVWMELMSTGPLSHLVTRTVDEARACNSCHGGPPMPPTGTATDDSKSGEYVVMPTD